VPQVLLSPRG